MAVVSDHRYTRSGSAFPNGGYGETRAFAGLDFQDCLLDSPAARALVGGARLHRWPINQLSLGGRKKKKKKEQAEPVGYEGTCGLH